MISGVLSVGMLFDIPVEDNYFNISRGRGLSPIVVYAPEYLSL